MPPHRCLAALAEARGGWPKYVTDMLASTDLADITEHGLFYRSGCLPRHIEKMYRFQAAWLPSSPYEKCAASRQAARYWRMAEVVGEAHAGSHLSAEFMWIGLPYPKP